MQDSSDLGDDVGLIPCIGDAPGRNKCSWHDQGRMVPEVSAVSPAIVAAQVVRSTHQVGRS